MGRVAKFLSLVAAWRWTPCVGLIASSLLFALLAIIVVPSTLKLPGPPAAGNALEIPEQPNAIGTPISRAPERETRPLSSPRQQMTPMPPSPPLIRPAAPEPPPPAPEPEEKREEPPPPPPPPPAQPAPQDEEDDEEQSEPAPTPTPPRFGAAPLRFLPQINRAVGNANGNAPPPGAERPEGAEPAPAGR
jgi:outer membrane biosynthesis protein TonB